MIKEYLKFRKIGHDKRTSFKRTIGDLLDSFSVLVGTRHYEPLEFALEDKLTRLEERGDSMDFCSLSDIENLVLNPKTRPPTFGYTQDELDFTRLYMIYRAQCGYEQQLFGTLEELDVQELLSSKQIKRVERLIKKVPSKFHEFFETTKSKEDFEGYIRKRDDLYGAKRDEWIEKFGRAEYDKLKRVFELKEVCSVIKEFP